MTDWIENSGLSTCLTDSERQLLASVNAGKLSKDTVLFQPGDAVRGFAIALSGRIGVYLTGQNGREILLYDIVPGQTCVQSTLGILGEEEYSAKAICETDCELALIPRDLFQKLLSASKGFRGFVFGTFAKRMQNMMHLLEQVAFVRVENRLAANLLARASEDVVHATHQELAVQIGTAREVISRRLDVLAKRGLVRMERGQVIILDPVALQEFAAEN
jgi:CRP/FNR family transcriptional regulator, anaerobic regulatory protein